MARWCRLQLLNSYFLDIPAVDIDLECLYDVGIMTTIADDKDDPVLVCFGQPELFVKRLVEKVFWYN